MIVKSIIVLTGFLLLQYKVHPQAVIGDNIHGWALTIEQPEKQSIQLNRWKGKFIILDFFTSSCVVCFKSLPKLNEHQARYKERLQLILIGKPDSRIRGIYDKYAERYGLNLSIAFDSLLFNRQKLEWVPYYIWIDDKGVVQGLTGIEQLSEQNIEDFLNRQYGQLKIEKKEKIPFDETRPLLVGNNGAPDDQFLYRSVLLNWNTSMETRYPPSIDFVSSPNTFQVMGVNLKSLYNYAYVGKDAWRPGDSLYGKQYNKPVWLTEDSVLTKNLFAYSLTLPSDRFDKKQLKLHMQQDLFRYFGYVVTQEIRNMPCWKLQATPESRARLKSTKKKMKSTGSKVRIDYEHVPVLNLIRVLQAYTFPNEILVDDTGIEGFIDIELEAVLTDPEDVKRALGKIGLQLIKSEKSMQVMDVRPDKNHPAPGLNAGAGW